MSKYFKLTVSSDEENFEKKSHKCDWEDRYQ